MTGRATAALLVLGISLLAHEAGAARSYGLHLGRPRLRQDGTVAVPVELRTPRKVQVAALNFTLTWDAARLTLARRGVVAGSAVHRARADLASRTDDAGGAVRVLAVPEFRADFAALKGSRIATVYLRSRGRTPARGMRRWVAHHLALHDVVLADARGRELSLRAAGRRP